MPVDTEENRWGNEMTNETVCLQVAQLLPGIVDGDVPSAVLKHLDTCLRCQAETSRYRKIARELDKLRDQISEPPIDLVAPVFDALEHASARRSKLKIAALGIGVGGAVVALGTVAGIAIKLRHRVVTHPIPA